MSSLKDRRRSEEARGRKRRREERAEDSERRGQDEREEATVYARWTGYGAQHERPGGRKVQAHVYATETKPTSPLEEGRRIRILAMPAARRVAPDASIDHYNLYDPHVRGEVIRIIKTNEGWARATVINECRGNAVGVIDLDFPFLLGVTVSRRDAESSRETTNRSEDTPEGADEWKGTPGGLPCGGPRCKLEPRIDEGMTSFRTAPKKRRGQTTRESGDGQAEEGIYQLHYWMKYEGY